MHSRRTARTVAALLATSAWLTAGLAQAAAADCVSPKILTESADDSSLTVVWSKAGSYHDVAAPTSWRVYNGSTKVCETGNGPTGKPNLYCHVTGLAANTQYTFTVKSWNGSSESSGVATTCSAGSSCKTQAAMTTVYLDTQSGVSQNTDSTAVTTAIQNALNSQCVSGKKLVVKSGETYISGGLNLPNNCTFEIDGTLQASTSASQYAYSSDRFPLYGTGGNYGSVHYPTNYTGLLNTCAGSSNCTASNIRLVGSGSVNGGQYSSGALTVLGNNEVSAQGTDSARADLLNLSGVTGLYLKGLKFTNPPEHIIFVSRSTNVSVEGITSNSYQGSDSSIHNGDGIDLATSTNASIFGSSFDDGDDCINLNAGSNLPGVTQNLPDGSSSGPIHIFDDTTNHGHGGVVFGSFTAAWIQNVTAEDNYHNGTDIGLRFKTGTNRGGGAQNVTLRDSTVNNIKTAVIQMTGSYADSTGYASAGVGYFKNITINNVTGSGASGAYAIQIDGNSSPRHTNFTFSNINVTGSSGKGVSIYQTNTSSFTNVTAASGNFYYDPTATGLTFSGCSPTPMAK